MTLLAASNIIKEVRDGERTARILDGVSLELAAGERVALVGPSGSGKSTLLHILGALDGDYKGEVRLAGTPLEGLSDRARSRLRGRDVGFVFQAYNLVARATVAENVALPSRFNGSHVSVEAVREVIDRVGLSGKADRRPHQLSGGERQRVAIARALVQKPKVVLCDEPTGNLDAETGDKILELFDTLTAAGVGLLIATHDRAIADSSRRELKLKDGKLS
ncbi:MAG: ABC transporter ATP-binding protein [Myxococcota bacterium]|nr:ABC transporter ATP-binding protein [Myxococcota bacterium]